MGTRNAERVFETQLHNVDCSGKISRPRKTRDSEARSLLLRRTSSAG